MNKAYCCDCIEGLANLDANSIDLTVTSPPYDNIRAYKGYVLNWNEVIKQLYRVTKQGGVVVWIVNDQTVNGSETGTSFKQAIHAMDCGFKLHDTMIWQKISPFQHKNRYISAFEYMFVFSKGCPKTANIICDRSNKWAGTTVHGRFQHGTDGTHTEISGKKKGRRIKEYGARYNIWNIPGDKNNKTGHPAVFPIQIPSDHIRTWSNEGDVVCDPFLGSGTTRIAAFELNRQFIGFEISKEYFDMQERRFADCVILFSN